MFCTYIHLRASDKKVFYVGKGLVSKKRPFSTGGRNKYWHHTVAKHGLIVEVCSVWQTNDEACDHEKFLIACFRDMGCDLVNMTDGGDGTLGHRPSDETLRKLTLLRTGKKRTDETKRKMSAAIKLSHSTQEYRDKYRASTLGKKKSDLAKANMKTAANREETKQKKRVAFAKRVLCVENGTVFCGAYDAARWVAANTDFKKAGNSKISSVARGDRNIAYGYRWAYI